MSKKKINKPVISCYSANINDFKVPKCNKDFISLITKDTFLQILNNTGLSSKDWGNNNKGIDELV